MLNSLQAHNLKNTLFDKSNYLKYCHWGVVVLAFAVPWSLALTNIALSWFFIFWLLSGEFKAKWQRIQATPIAWLAILLFGWMFLSVLWSPADSFTETTILWRYARYLSLPLIISVLTNEELQNKILKGYYLGVIVMLLGAILTWAGWYDGRIYSRYGQTEYSGFVSTVTHGPHAAFFIYLSVLFAWRFSRFRWLFIALALWASADILFVIMNRTAFLVLAPLVGCLFFIFLQRYKKIAIGLLAAVMLACAAAYMTLPQISQRIQSVPQEIASFNVNENATSSGIRFFYLKVTWGMFQQHPLIGNGVGAFRHYIHDVQKYPNSIGDLWHAHNDYMGLAADTGAIGLLLYLLILACAFRNILRQESGLLKYCCVGGWVCIVFVGMTDVAIYPLTYMPLLFLALTVKLPEAKMRNTDANI